MPRSPLIPPGHYRPPGGSAPLYPTTSQQASLRRLLEQIAAEAAELEHGAVAQLVPVLHDARRELIRDLRGWLLRVPEGGLRFTAQRYREALLAIDGTMHELARLRPALRAALTEAQERSGRLAVGHLRFEVARMSAVFGELSIPQLSTAAVLTAGRRQLIPRYRTSAARYAGRVVEDLRHQFGVGLARGETFTELTERLRRLGGPRGLVALRGVAGEPGAVVEDIAEGLFRRYRYWGERVVRTEVMHGYNLQHAQAIDALNRDRIEAGDTPLLKRWDASLDSRLCQMCANLDRRAVPADEPFAPGIPHPPAHPNCRCVVTAWNKRWGNIKGETRARV